MALLPASFRHGAGLQFDATPTYAYILYNVGWADAATLGPLVAGWRNAFRLLQADLVVADHSPTALLAARSMGLPAIVWGSGFCLPPNTTPLPDMMPWRQTPPEQVRRVEATVLGAANAVRARHGTRPLACLADLFYQGPQRFLLALPDLDHYPACSGEMYRGWPPPEPGLVPDWTACGGPRVFAYLKPLPRPAGPAGGSGSATGRGAGVCE